MVKGQKSFYVLIQSLSNLNSCIWFTANHNPQLLFLYWWNPKLSGLKTTKNSASDKKDMSMLNEPLIFQENQTPTPFPTALLNYLYVGHFLSRWSARLQLCTLFSGFSSLILRFGFENCSLVKFFIVVQFGSDVLCFLSLFFW